MNGISKEHEFIHLYQPFFLSFMNNTIPFCEVYFSSFIVIRFKNQIDYMIKIILIAKYNRRVCMISEEYVPRLLFIMIFK